MILAIVTAGPGSVVHQILFSFLFANTTSLSLLFLRLSLPSLTSSLLALLFVSADGLKFFKSANEVILCTGDENGYIAPKYFQRVVQRSDGMIQSCHYLDGFELMMHSLSSETLFLRSFLLPLQS